MSGVNDSKQIVPRGERRAYGWYFVGQNMVYLFILNYIQNYFTDVVGIAAGSTSLGLGWPLVSFRYLLYRFSVFHRLGRSRKKLLSAGSFM
jgi:hypothetical protein